MRIRLTVCLDFSGPLALLRSLFRWEAHRINRPARKRVEKDKNQTALPLVQVEYDIPARDTEKPA